jgi:hypothetical protein
MKKWQVSLIIVIAVAILAGIVTLIVLYGMPKKVTPNSITSGTTTESTSDIKTSTTQTVTSTMSEEAASPPMTAAMVSEAQAMKIPSAAVSIDTKRFLKYILENVAVVNGIVIPKSYYVVPGYFEKKANSTDTYLKSASAKERYDRCSEQFYQTKGTNIYDSSLWVITWCLQIAESDEDVSAAILPWLTHMMNGNDAEDSLVGTRTRDLDWSYNSVAQSDDVWYNIRKAGQVSYKTDVPNRFCRIQNRTLGGAFDGSDIYVDPDVCPGCTLKDIIPGHHTKVQQPGLASLVPATCTTASGWTLRSARR